MADIAAAVAAEFPAARVPDVARKLLLTAATRGHVAAMDTLLLCDSVWQQVDAASVEFMLTQLIKGRNLVGFELVCEWPPAQQLDSAAVARLLQAVLQQNRRGFIERLLRFPAAEQLNGDSVAQLLVAAVKHASGIKCSVHLLCQLPGAQQLDSTALEPVLDAAVRRGRYVSTWDLDQLMQLPAAAQLTFDAVVRLLDSALMCHACHCRSRKLVRPVKEQLTPDIVVQLLQTAMNVERVNCCPPWHATFSLYTLPAAAHISAEVLAQLLGAAFTASDRWRNDDTGRYLCRLPSAKLLSSDTVAQLLLQAAGRRGETSVHSVCKLPAAQQLSSPVVYQLLRKAVEHGNGGPLRSFCELPGAKQLCSSSIAELDRMAAGKFLHPSGRKVVERCLQNLRRHVVRE
jgi:hypothetical protein